MSGWSSLFWAAAMAWRDGRKSWKRLFVYLSATSLGIAALVAAGSFRENLQEAIRVQAKPLLGADVVVRNRRAFDDAAMAFFRSLPHPRVQETRFTTMAYFPAADAGRLTDVRAAEAGFPFYGEIHTDPPGAFDRLFQEPSILMEENARAEFGLRPGDAVVLGTTEFRIAGFLKLVPGEAVASVFSAPRAYIAHAFLQGTNLIKPESLSRQSVYFKIPDEAERERVLSMIQQKADRAGWRIDTVAERQKSLGRQARNAERFLNLAALVMLILGGIGVAGIMQVYAREKWTTAATLKCLGAPAGWTLGIFALQAACLAVLGSLLGGGLGILFQSLLPALLARFVSLSIPFFISWTAVGAGVAVGSTLCFLFTMLPLAPLRSVPPLAAFRFGYEVRRPAAKDPFVWACGVSIAALLFLFSLKQMPNAWAAALVPVGLAGALLLLAFLTRLSLKWLRLHLRESLPYAWRQGLASLFRPNNQTFLLVPILGLGAGLLFAISFSHIALLRHLTFSSSGAEPNLALFDIQRDQRDAVKRVLSEAGRPVLEEAPVVSMRLERIKDRTVEDLRRDKQANLPGWALNHDYRSTYRNRLTSGEDILKGRWPVTEFDKNGRIPISLEEDLAKTIGVSVGDEMVFNVQGVSLTTVIASLRKVDWYQLRPNFFAVFPEGVLEDAPQFYVMMVHASTPGDSAAAQKRVRAQFPNVSMLDLRLILATLDDYLSKVAFVLRFMGFFVVGTGVLVLCGALLSTRFERVREAAILRTLGASRSEIRIIHMIEYGLIGFFSGTAGLILGGLAGFFLTRYLFEIRPYPAYGTGFAGLAGVVALTMAIGFFLGRGMLRRPPLETLREE